MLVHPVGLSATERKRLYRAADYSIDKGWDYAFFRSGIHKGCYVPYIDLDIHDFARRLMVIVGRNFDYTVEHY